MITPLLHSGLNPWRSLNAALDGAHPLTALALYGLGRWSLDCTGIKPTPDRWMRRQSDPQASVN